MSDLPAFPPSPVTVVHTLNNEQINTRVEALRIACADFDKAIATSYDELSKKPKDGVVMIRARARVLRHIKRLRKAYIDNIHKKAIDVPQILSEVLKRDESTPAMLKEFDQHILTLQPTRQTRADDIVAAAGQEEDYTAHESTHTSASPPDRHIIDVSTIHAVDNLNFNAVSTALPATTQQSSMTSMVSTPARGSEPVSHLLETRRVFLPNTTQAPPTTEEEQSVPVINPASAEQLPAPAEDAAGTDSTNAPEVPVPPAVTNVVLDGTAIQASARTKDPKRQVLQGTDMKSVASHQQQDFSPQRQPTDTVVARADMIEAAAVPDEASAPLKQYKLITTDALRRHTNNTIVNPSAASTTHSRITSASLKSRIIQQLQLEKIANETQQEFEADEQALEAQFARLRLERNKLKLAKEHRILELKLKAASEHSVKGSHSSVRSEQPPISVGAPSQARSRPSAQVQRYLRSLQTDPPTAPATVPPVQAASLVKPTQQPIIITQAPINDQLMQTFIDQGYMNRMPVVEPPIFNGDPLKYSDWDHSFVTLVEQRAVRDTDRLHYLKKYLGGEALDAVEGFLHLDTAGAYADAKQLLKERFGNPFTLANAYRNKLEAWPRVGGSDSKALRRYSDFLRQCLTAMKSIPSLAVLDDDRENRKMLSKLPNWLVNRWARRVAEYQRSRGFYPRFHTFVEFVTTESDITSNPITSIAGLKEDAKDRKKDDKQARTLATEQAAAKPQGKPKAAKPAAASATGSPCVSCNQNHRLWKCPVFTAMQPVQKQDVIRLNKLCYKCLRPGHLKADCTLDVTCDICQRPHTTLMHSSGPLITSKNQQQRAPGAPQGPKPTRPQFQQSYNAQAYSYGQEVQQPALPAQTSYVGQDARFSQGQTQPPATLNPNAQPYQQQGHQSHVARTSLKSHVAACASTMIVPVHLSSQRSPGKEVLTYAMIDSQSDTSFILESTANALGVDGVTVPLRLSTLTSSKERINCQRILKLTARSYYGSEPVDLPPLFSRPAMPCNRNHIPTEETIRAWPHLRRLQGQVPPMQSCDVGLLIGYDCVQALAPLDIIASPEPNMPFAQRTLLGWGIIGPAAGEDFSAETFSHTAVCHRVVAQTVHPPGSAVLVAPVRTKEIMQPREIMEALERDFKDTDDAGTEVLSRNDRKFLEIMETGITTEADGHYSLPLPLTPKISELQNNRSTAFKRLQGLRTKFTRDPKYKQEYLKFMTEMFSSRYAEACGPPTGPAWYIPHHAVFHAQKGKIRVVFDGSCRGPGPSLNECLYQGPDLANSLLGVLLRFNRERIALVADVKKMFYQFRVHEEHRDYLRFLWWPCGDTAKAPLDHRMTVHVFGATSSPGVANFALKHAAEERRGRYSPAVIDYIQKDFYVDDGLTSVSTVKEAIDLATEARALCAEAGLKLHKIMSNSVQVIQSVPVEDRATDIELDLTSTDQLPVERALGIQWSVHEDHYQFEVKLKSKPMTRRGILSLVSSVYDPLGFVSPFILLGRFILRDLCKEGVTWDEPISPEITARWTSWLTDVKMLSAIKIPRCTKPSSFGDAIRHELHVFSDASELGYGVVSYLKSFNAVNAWYIQFVLSKARVASLKKVSIPRLELVASVLAVKISKKLLLELRLIAPVTTHFWVDSQVVLAYIANQSRSFHTFVANRVAYIQDNTSPDQWNFVAGRLNPADHASRGLTSAALEQCTAWLQAPLYLHTDKQATELREAASDGMSYQHLLDDEDPEVRRTCLTTTPPNIDKLPPLKLDEIINRASSWSRLRRMIAILRGVFKNKQRGMRPLFQQPTIANLEDADTALIITAQRSSFQDQRDTVQLGLPLPTRDPLSKLCPFVDQHGIFRVGGRLQLAEVSDEERHPVILPKQHHVSLLIVRYLHEKSAHQGRATTINAVRQAGFWVVSLTKLVSSLIHQCVTCRRLRGKTQEQQMSTLPADRVNESPPFSYVAVDFFGPFFVTERRSKVKRWGVIFVCMNSRAVHLETSTELSTDAFINCFRRFKAIRGPIRLLRCDRGSNFVGMLSEYTKALAELNDDAVKQRLVQQGCDFEVKFTPATGSHHAGSWERLIADCKKILYSITTTHPTTLTDEMLRTFLLESAAIVNSRPLTTCTLGDPTAPVPLNPAALLTMKLKPLLPPPGQFTKNDVYCRKRWRQAQYLIELFWKRFRSEYLQHLHARQKWRSPTRNVSVGDVVVLRETTALRNEWYLARVIQVAPSADGLVRRIWIRLATSLDDKGKPLQVASILERPVTKVVVLVESES